MISAHEEPEKRTPIEEDEYRRMYRFVLKKLKLKPEDWEFNSLASPEGFCEILRIMGENGWLYEITNLDVEFGRRKGFDGHRVFQSIQFEKYSQREAAIVSAAYVLGFEDS